MKKSLLALSLTLSLCSPQAFSAEFSLVPKTGLMAVPAISLRCERDHRIEYYSEKYKDDDATHVFLFLSDQSVPYIVTLGWFYPIQSKDGLAYLDDFGERLPAPGEKPARGAFNKADLAVIRGFDLLGDGNLKGAQGAFEEAVKLAPLSPKAHMNLGVCQAINQQYDRAQESFDKALELKPDYRAVLCNRAWLRLVQKDPKAAVEDAKKALALKSDFKAALVALTKAYILSGQVQDAKLSAQELARRWPNDAVVLEMAAESSLSAGELKPAKQYYQKYLMLMPRDVGAILRVAEIYQRLGDLDNAMKYARSATQAKADSSAAHLVLGRFLEANRDYRAAQIQYDRASETAKTPEERIAVQGPTLRILFVMNKFADADKLSKKWAAENPENADCRYNRAWVTSQIGGAESKTEAIAEYRKALALKPELREVHYNLGLLLAAAGKPSEAAKELKLFIEKAPDDPDIQKARELLAKLSH